MSGLRGTEDVEWWRVRGGPDASNVRGAALTSVAVQPSVAPPQLANLTTSAAVAQPEPMPVPWLQPRPFQPLSYSRPFPPVYPTVPVFPFGPPPPIYPGPNLFNLPPIPNIAQPMAPPQAPAPTITRHENVQPVPYSSIYTQNQNPGTAVPKAAMGQLQIAASPAAFQAAAAADRYQAAPAIAAPQPQVAPAGCTVPRHMRDRTRLST